MKRTRIFKLALSLVLALVTVALAGWSIQRKVQSFQALGFDAAIAGGSVLVGRVSAPRGFVLWLPGPEGPGISS